jgi:hypothetical protein
MSELAVPDLVREVVAWRAWRVIGGVKLPMLASATHGDTIWHPDRWTYATCCDRDACLRSSDGKVPGERCSCGMYAANTRKRLLELGYNRYESTARPVLIGEVGLAGKVIPGSFGWRAERARIVRLELAYELFRFAEPLETLYRVPVLFANTLR